MALYWIGILKAGYERPISQASMILGIPTPDRLVNDVVDVRSVAEHPLNPGIKASPQPFDYGDAPVELDEYTLFGIQFEQEAAQVRYDTAQHKFVAVNTQFLLDEHIGFRDQQIAGRATLEAALTGMTPGTPEYEQVETTIANVTAFLASWSDLQIPRLQARTDGQPIVEAVTPPTYEVS